MIIIEKDLINITEQPTVINITETGAIIQTTVNDIPELTQAQVEDSTSTVFGSVSGERVRQGIDAWKVDVGGVGRDTAPYSNLTATTIDFSDMYDNVDPLDDHNESLWTFGTGTIEASSPTTGVILFEAPSSGKSRYGVIRIDFTNAPLFAVGAWPTGKNLTDGGTEPTFEAGIKYADVFITINDFGIQYKTAPWSA